MFDSKEFGKIETVWEKVPVGGLLIREGHGVILLEECLDTEGNFDVVHMFDEDKTMDDKEDLQDIIYTAREYRPDLSDPIFIKVRAAKHKEDEDAKKALRDNFSSVVKKTWKHPWNCVW